MSIKDMLVGKKAEPKTFKKFMVSGKKKLLEVY